MANTARELFLSFQKKGLTDRESLFAIIDHYAKLHCFDRDHYANVTQELRRENAELKGRIAALESR